MKLHQIDLKSGQWLGSSKTVADTAPIPRGWVVFDLDPLPGQRWGGSRGWIGEPTATKDDSARLEALYKSCMEWQSRPSDPHTCDSNFFALLTSVSAVAKIAGVPVATKAAACLAWLDALWGDYYVRKANGSTDYNFSSHGGCPHSFLEVREEAGE